MSSESSGPAESRLPRGLWREALAGTHRDLTSIGLGTAIFLLAVPMVMEMAMESLFGVVDIFFVARLGHNAVATVGLTESLLALVFGVALGLSMATTAMVARRIGEKDVEGAAVAAVQAIGIGLIVSAAVGTIGITMAPRLLSLMGASADVIAGGHRYTATLLGTSVVIFLLFLINAIFRGAGDAALAMRTLWLANGINIILDPCLINGWGPFPEMGVMGAAVATTIGRGTGVAYQLWLLYTRKSRVIIARPQLRLDPKAMIRLLQVSVVGMFQFLLTTASWMALVRIIAIFGSAAVAGYTIAIRLFIFVILPSWGMCNAAATLVGQNLGAKKPERSEQAVYRTGFYNVVFLGLVSIVFLTCAQSLASFFTKEAAVIQVAVQCMHTLAWGNVFYAWGMVMTQAFNGAGDTRTPTLINLFCYWVLQIPLAYVLAVRAGWGPQGAFTAIPMAEVVLAGVSLMLFRQGRWKRQSI